MMKNKSVNIFWFRRDLRLKDNRGLARALAGDLPVLCVFIFDPEILEKLPKNDSRVSFIFAQIQFLKEELESYGSSLLILNDPIENAWSQILKDWNVKEVFCNRDYEPYAIQRDKLVYKRLKENNISFKGIKDQVIFDKNDILKPDGTPYTVFTPYKKKWLSHFATPLLQSERGDFSNLHQIKPFPDPNLKQIGFTKGPYPVKDIHWEAIKGYGHLRDIPSKSHTSYLGPHLRFGCISVREVFRKLKPADEVFQSELIWREFFMQILYHFPNVEKESFRAKYRQIKWRNKVEEFQKWCTGNTGYPIVDAGMRELNQTGYMHNRVRMICASFLCKHLLIDWRWGEEYFAEKLLDFELSANNGNWQWTAGTGCDAAPYFRVFNPEAQQKKFDPNFEYIRKWVPEWNTIDYTSPMVEHKFARERALKVYKESIQ